MSLRAVLLAGMAASSATAVKILVSGYGPTSSNIADGYVNTYNYDGKAIVEQSQNTGSGPQPTWIDLVKPKTLFTLDEAWNTPNTSGIHTWNINPNGSLEHTAVFQIPRGGPVSTQFYNNNKNLAVAHYGGHGLTTFKVAPSGAVELLQNIGYEDRPHGPKPQQADGSHVHHSVIDPTGQYIVFPDLGLDTTHVFRINCSSAGTLAEQAELKAPVGSGPRHAAFWKSPSKATYLFIVHELVNKVISYEVTYVKSGGLTFKQVDEQSTYGPTADPALTQFGAAAEIAVSPDNAFLLTSNRNVTLQQVPNVDPSNSTQIPSNSIATFKPTADGKLVFVQLAASGGLFPRHFSFNPKGDELLVANQNSGNVRIYKRDLATGLVGQQIAAVTVPGSPNFVRWLS